jgi:hypothetical protein
MKNVTINFIQFLLRALKPVFAVRSECDADGLGGPIANVLCPAHLHRFSRHNCRQPGA